MRWLNIRVWGVLLLCVVLGGLSTGLVAAQKNDCPGAAEFIEYGDTVKGEITSDEIFLFYCFVGEKGDEIVIDLEATDGTLDTYLLLSDVNVENFYAENDDISAKDTNSHIEFTLEDDGAYVIAATRADGNDGRTRGSFALTLDTASRKTTSQSSSSSGSAEGGECPVGSYVAIPGYSMSSSIDDDNYLRSYCFYGTEGTDYRMSVEATSDDLDPLVFVTTPDLETVLANNDNASSRTTDARLDFTPESDGIYLVVVSRAELDKGDTKGEYLLTLDNRTTDEADVCPEALAFPASGVSVGRVTDTFMHTYCFNGSEGDEVALNVEAQRGSLDMVTFITAANLDTVEQGESKKDTLSMSATLPADGPYLVIVFDLTGEGRFDMTFENGSGSASNNRSGGDGTLGSVFGSQDSSTTNSGDCDAEPLSFLVNGNWSSTSNTGTMQMDFDCDGNVSVTMNGNSFETTYTLEGDTLTLALDNGDMVVEGVLLTKTALIGTSNGQAFMLLNKPR